MRTQIAIVSNTSLNMYQGYFQAVLKDTNVEVPVVMTSPIASHPVSSRYYRYSGLYGMPTQGSEIIIKRVDGSKFWYFDSVVAIPTKIVEKDTALGEEEDKPYEQGSQLWLGDSMNDYRLEPFSQVQGMISAEGNKLELSDSHNKNEREIFARLKDKIGNNLGLFASQGFASFKNEKRDGITITSEDTQSAYGGRRIRTVADGSITTTTKKGRMRFSVGSGGTTFDIENTAIPGFNGADIPTDNDTGSVNISTQFNDVTIKGFSPTSRVFIDATELNGAVCIKAGLGGVEVYTDGDINMACGGNFNVRAQGVINLKGTQVQLNPDYELPKVTKEQFTKDNSELAEDLLA